MFLRSTLSSILISCERSIGALGLSVELSGCSCGHCSHHLKWHSVLYFREIPWHNSVYFSGSWAPHPAPPHPIPPCSTSPHPIPHPMPHNWIVFGQVSRPARVSGRVAGQGEWAGGLGLSLCDTCVLVSHGTAGSSGLFRSIDGQGRVVGGLGPHQPLSLIPGREHRWLLAGAAIEAELMEALAHGSMGPCWGPPCWQP